MNAQGDPVSGGQPFDLSPAAPALHPASALLRILNGPAAGRAFPLNAVRLLIGRSDPPIHFADIDLTDCELGQTPKISRRHAELRWVDDTLQILDLGSSNGTDVNGERLVAVGRPGAVPIILLPGDHLRFANLECEIALQ
jgi:pSer/pThr/pTyr-binding forkhead associated (FHA) protein